MPPTLVALLLDPAADEAVVCSHGELIGAALKRLLEVDGGRLQHGRYLPPLRLHDAEAGYY
jgi:hypothetical protein